jgi:thiamine-phosphate pyrophosphorylase
MADMAAGSDPEPPAAVRHQLILERVSAWAAGGVDLIQIRERDLEAAELLALVSACVDAAHRTDALIVVNERADVALAAGAHGTHLRADSLPAGRLRQVVPAGFLLGRSVHGAVDVSDELRDLDYLVAGPVFASRSKSPGHATLGVAGLRDIAARAPVVLGIGGISIANVASVARAGAAGLAAIDLFGGITDAATSRDLVSRLRQVWREATG